MKNSVLLLTKKDYEDYLVVRKTDSPEERERSICSFLEIFLEKAGYGLIREENNIVGIKVIIVFKKRKSLFEKIADWIFD